jgi:diguanylate cyclase (GGDEF)-like protein
VRGLVPSARVLIVDADTVAATQAADVLAKDGHDVELALQLPDDDVAACEVVVVDPGDDDAGDLLEVLRAKPWASTAEVIFVSARGDVEAAVTALHRGASDWLAKPVADARLRLAISRAIERRRLLRENRRLRRDLELFAAAQRVLETLDRQQLAVVGTDVLCSVPGVVAAAIWGDDLRAARGLDDDEAASLVSHARPEAFVETLSGAALGVPRFPRGHLMDLGGGVTAAVLSTIILAPSDLEGLLFLTRQLANAVENSERYRIAAEQALRDPLTGLWNAAAFADAVDAQVAGGAAPFSVLFLDVDRFKNVNDTHGHLVGSATLVQIARTVLENVREGDVVSRYGGDELTVLLPGVDVDDARHIAERIRAGVSSTLLPATPELRVTVSVGVASWPRHASETRGLLAAADVAMYRGKANARNRVVVAEDDALR